MFSRTPGGAAISTRRQSARNCRIAYSTPRDQANFPLCTHPRQNRVAGPHERPRSRCPKKLPGAKECPGTQRCGG
jgi:hypothetical protein